MRAPVYRSIDAASTFLGLAFPTEVLAVLLVFWGSILLTTPALSVLATVGAYAALRLGTVGRPPQYLQHLLLFLARTARTRGHYSAAARSLPQPRFPFAPTAFRDGPVSPP